MTTPETEKLAERLAKCVKPLEWKGHERGWMHADCYRVGHNGHCWVLSQTDAAHGHVRPFSEQRYALSAAQADYTARILAALDTDAIARLVAEAVEKERAGCIAIVQADAHYKHAERIIAAIRARGDA